MHGDEPAEQQERLHSNLVLEALTLLRAGNPCASVDQAYTQPSEELIQLMSTDNLRCWIGNYKIRERIQATIYSAATPPGLLKRKSLKKEEVRKLISRGGKLFRQREQQILVSTKAALGLGNHR
jgi:hypothetical protein